MSSISVVKKKLIISMTAIVLLIITLFGITYAYFSAKVTGNKNDESVSVGAGSLSLVYNDGNNTIIASGIEPNTTIKSKTFTVENNGDNRVENYDVILENVINELDDYEDLTYTLTCKSTDEFECSGSSGVFPKSQEVIATNSINPGVIHEYSLTLTYKETGSDQSHDMNKLIEAKVNIKDDVYNVKKMLVHGNSIQNGTPTLDNPIEIQSLGDKTENLFDFPSESKVNNGVTITKNIDGTITLNGTATADTDFRLISTTDTDYFIPIYSGRYYKLSTKEYGGKVSNGWYTIHASSYINEEQTWGWIDKNQNNALSPSRDGEIRLVICYFTAGTFFDNLTLGVQIEELDSASSKHSDYEPYGYKVPIEMSGKNMIRPIDGTYNNGNIIVKNGEINIISEIEIDGYSVEIPCEFIQGELNKTYTLGWGGNTISSLGESSIRVILKDGSTKAEWGNWEKSTFTLSSKIDKVKLLLSKNDPELVGKKIYIQLEEGTEATQYEQSTAKRFYIYLDEPLRKVGNYTDYIDFENKTIIRNTDYVNYKISEMNNSEDYPGWKNQTEFIKYFPNQNVQLNTLTDIMSNISSNTGFGLNSKSVGIIWLEKNHFGKTQTELINNYNNLNVELLYGIPKSKVEAINIPDFNFNSNKKIIVCDSKNVCASNIEIEYDE